jgi:hypothetical protein
MLPLLFAVFTNHVWEDYYITFRASKNLAEGHGLVYQIGERVHSFTSPLGVLLPALLYTITGSDDFTLWGFRLLSCAALSWAVVLLWKTLEEQGTSLAARWVVTLLLMFESKLVDFTINGMETPLMLLFAAMVFRLALRGPQPSSLPLGTAVAGLMWTRPDGFIIALAILASALAFTLRSRTQLVESTKYLLKAAGGTLLLYGPWVAWAWWYYGSAIPNTIIAKSGAMPDLGAGYFITAPFGYLTGQSAMIDLLNPTYRFFGGWPNGFIQLDHALAIIAGFLWLVPRLPMGARIASLALFLGSYYLQAIPPAPWYFPVWNMLAAVALGLAASTWLARSRNGSLRGSLARCTITLLLVVQAGTVGLAAWQLRHQQSIIENQGRRAVGEWLALHAEKTDTVFLEPLGYIGYFSQLHMLDYPGLSAPSVTAAMHQVGPNFSDLIQVLHPTWLVIRPHELAGHGFSKSNVLAEYDVIKRWDVRAQLDAVTVLPGRNWLDVDAVFLLFHRRDEPAR